MRLPLVITFLAAGAVSEASRPPWYKPCWIYLCGLDLTDPVCTWDPRHGARLFRNSCEMNRHNFCYNRNYAIIDGENSVAEDMKLCTKLKAIVENAEDGRPSVVEDGNVRVQFLEGPSNQAEHRGQRVKGVGEKVRLSPWDSSPYRRSRLGRRLVDSGSSQEDTSLFS